MTHDRKIEYMMQDLTGRGLLQGEIAPIIYRIFWHYGIYVIPPYFSSFWQLFFFQGTMYGIIFSLIAWPVFFMVMGGPVRGISIVFIIASCINAGVIFALPISVYYRMKAKKLKLPSWDDYGRT